MVLLLVFILLEMLLLLVLLPFLLLALHPLLLRLHTFVDVAVADVGFVYFVVLEVVKDFYQQPFSAVAGIRRPCGDWCCHNCSV